MLKARIGGWRHVDDLERVTRLEDGLDKGPDVSLGLGGGAVWGKAMVDGQDRLVGHDVARDAAGDMHRLEALTELAARDNRPARLVAVDDLQ